MKIICVENTFFSIAGTSEGSMANSTLTPAGLEAQIPTSSDPLSAGGTSVTSSLTQPLVADKLMWSPSAGARTENQAPSKGWEGVGAWGEVGGGNHQAQREGEEMGWRGRATAGGVCQGDCKRRVCGLHLLEPG